VANRVLDFYNKLFSLGATDQARIYENLGRGFRKKGLNDKALTAYRELIRLNPNHLEAHLQMGRIYLGRSELELAIRSYQTVLKAKPNHAEALHGLGMAHARSGEMEQATEMFEKAVEQAADRHEWLYRLGVLYDKQGQGEQAIEKLQRALEIKGDEPRYHQYLGFVYEGMGRHDDAIPHFKAVMEHESGVEDVFYLESDPAIDVSRRVDVEKMIQLAMETFGKIDTIVNCAGVWIPGQTLIECSDENWNNVIDINLTGYFNVTRNMILNMLKRKETADFHNKRSLT